MILWLVIAVMTAVALALVLVPLVLRHRRAPRRVEFDLTVYRDQLVELESDRARGLVGEDQSEAARLEIQRRMLAASKREDGETAAAEGTEEAAAAGTEDVAPEPGGAGRHWLLMAAIGATIPALAVAAYLVLGSPGTPGKPFSGVAQRGGTTGEDMAGQTVEAAIANLAKRLEEDPDNLEGWLLLGRSLITLERYGDAAKALRTAVTLSNGDPEIIGSMAEALVFAAQGIVTADALAAFETVLGVRPNDAAAQYYIGISLAQQGRHGDALEMWRKLAAETPADALWRADLVTWMRRAAEETGIELGSIPSAPASARQAAEAAPGPSQEDMAAAAEMSPEERMDMIRAMVAQLAARLADEPDDLDGWRRLANSYRVLGEDANAAAAEQRVGELEAGTAQPAETAPGPSQEDMAAAAEMSAEERNDMIRAMVARLAARLEEEPDDLDGWRRLANSYRVLGEDAKAAAAQQRVSELEAGAAQPAEAAPGPSAEDIAAAEGMSAEQQAQMIGAMVTQLAERLSENPDDLEGWLRLGRSYSVLSRHAESRDAYARAADIAPDDTTVLRGYARAVMSAAGNVTQFPEQAIVLYQRILKLDPNQPEALWFMGLVEAADGRNDAARGFWKRLLDLLPAGGADRSVVERALNELPD